MPDVPGFAMTLAPDDDASGIRLNMHEGILRISIPDHAHFHQAVHLRWDHPDCGNRTRIEVHIGKQANVVIVEEMRSTMSAAASWDHSVELFLEEGARVEFVSEQTVDPALTVKISQRSHVGDNATILWRNVTLGGHDVTHDLMSELPGANAASDVHWIFYAKADEKVRLSARNSFLGRRGGGEIIMKGVAEQKAHAACDGMIYIGPHGGQTDTYLTQDVLMLDPTARVDAVPGLEIQTNDVKASHSATVTRVTGDDLFYFGSRGIGESEARRMFIEGFLGELVSAVSDASTRERVHAAVEAKYAIGR